MGCGSSTQTEAGLSPYEPVLPPLSPYAGPSIQYHFVVVNANLRTNEGYCTSLKLEASNTDQYFPTLANMYQQGYRLVLNVCLPVTTKLNYGWSDVSSRVMYARYLGVFRLGFADELNNQVQLRVKNAVVVHKIVDPTQQAFYNNDANIPTCVSNNQAVYDMFGKISSEGGRIICLEYSGMARQQVDVYRVSYAPAEDSETAQYYDPGPAAEMHLTVNVYYETPVTPSNEIYNYDFVTFPMTVSGTSVWQRSSRKLYLDWHTAVRQHMDTGWKLVDVFDDQSASVDRGFDVTKMLLWIFEKPASRLADTSPVYELTMQELWFVAKKHVSGMHPSDIVYPTEVEPLLNHMASAGWEVVRIMETPEQKYKGLLSLTFYIKYLLFFQRRIVRTPEPDHPPATAPTLESIQS